MILRNIISRWISTDLSELLKRWKEIVSIGQGSEIELHSSLSKIIFVSNLRKTEIVLFMKCNIHFKALDLI